MAHADPIEPSEEDWSYLTFLFALLTIVLFLSAGLARAPFGGIRQHEHV